MENDTIRKTAQFFKDEKQSVHISLNNFLFNNGIIKNVEVDFLIIDDERHGEIPVFFSEIYNIEPREEKK